MPLGATECCRVVWLVVIAAGCAVAVPARADFYRYPMAGRLAAKPVGTMLASQPMRFAGRPRPARALRIMYRSEDGTGKPIAVTGFVMVPRGRPPRGGWPIIAWGHGTTGVGPRCAPSRSPFLFPEERGLEPYTGYASLIARLLSDGFVVVGTDYVGLGFPGRLHTYSQLDDEARAMIDAVRAARQLVPHTSKRWFAVGHSEGGQAALGAGLYASLRAPGLTYLGTVSIAPGSSFAALPVVLSSFHPPYKPGIGDVLSYASYIAISVKLFARFRYTDLLSPEVARQIPSAERLCLSALSTHFGKLRPHPSKLVNPNSAASTSFLRFASINEPARFRSSGPVMLVQGDKDLSIPKFVTDRLNGELCGLGDTVDYATYPGADHDTVIPRAYPDIVRWLRDRLTRRATPQTCPR